MENKPLRAIVIGGGIAGPALSLFLDRAAVEARIFEAYQHADNVGGAFQIAPNGMRVLEALGLAGPVAAAGSAAEGFLFRNHRGRVIGAMQADRSGKAITTMRSPFYGQLLGAVARAGVPIAYGKRLHAISDDGDQVTAHFEDGSSASGDLLVGADGVHSRVRACILPEHGKPRYTGMLGVGGLAAADVAISDEMAQHRTLNFILGPRLSFGYAQMSGTERSWGWWCHLPQEEELSRRDLQALPIAERVAQAFAGWCEPVGALTATTRTVMRTAIYDVPPLPAWSRGRVVLIGDAAHAMSPAAGQGASLALEDAMLLGKLLAGAKRPLPELLATFEQRRRRRAESISAVARSNDERSLKSLGRFGCWMRDHAFPLLAPLMARSLEKQYAAPI